MALTPQEKRENREIALIARLAFMHGTKEADMAIVVQSKQKCRAHKYIAAITEDDPFDVPNLLKLIQFNVVNPRTQEIITNIQEACAYAAMQCEELHEQNMVKRAERRASDNAKRQKAYRDRLKELTESNPERIRLKAELELAVSNRAKAQQQADAYLAQQAEKCKAHLAYLDSGIATLKQQIANVKFKLSGSFGKLGDTSSDLYK